MKICSFRCFLHGGFSEPRSAGRRGSCRAGCNNSTKRRRGGYFWEITQKLGIPLLFRGFNGGASNSHPRSRKGSQVGSGRGKTSQVVIISKPYQSRFEPKKQAPCEVAEALFPRCNTLIFCVTRERRLVGFCWRWSRIANICRRIAEKDALVAKQ